MAVTINSVKAKTAPVREDNADFESVFQEHWQKVCRLLSRMLGDPAEAEDLALEVFWRFYRRPPQEKAFLGGWLYRVATNLGYNALRSRQRRQNYEEQAGKLDLEQQVRTNPLLEVERAEERSQVRQTLAQMKPRSAQILLLRYSGFSYTEIAAALDISPNSIGKLLARAEEEFEKKFPSQEGR